MRGTLADQARKLAALADEARERLDELERRVDAAFEYGIPGPSPETLAAARREYDERRAAADRAQQQLHEAA